MWRPGDPAPFALSGKGGKAAGKRKKKAPRKSGGGGKAADGGKALLTGGPPAKKVDEEYMEAPVNSDAFLVAPRATGKPTQQLSSTVRNLRFMTRKDEEADARRAAAELKRKEREQKWVIDSALLETDSGQLVCEPLMTAPRSAAGRRSFNAFNPVVEAAVKEAHDAQADAEETAAFDAEAIDASEMTAVLGKSKRELERGAKSKAAAESSEGQQKRRKSRS